MMVLPVALYICVLFPLILSDGVNVISYNDSTFKEEINKKPHFVKFFAPWCGHCKRMAGTWEDLAAKFNKKDDGDVIIAKVDCTIESSLCSDQGVTGYPTLKFYKTGTEEGHKYRGPRDLPALSAFVLESLGQNQINTDDPIEIPQPKHGLVELTDNNFSTVIAKGQHLIKFYAPWCGHCQKLAPVWEDLAQSYGHDPSITISKIDCTTHRTACNEFEVKAYPTLLWIVDGKKVDRYQGGRSHEELKSYINQMKAFQDPKPEEVPEKTEEEIGNQVVQLSTENFETAIATGVTFVKFYAPWCGHCRRLQSTWEDLSLKYRNQANVKIAKVDCTQHETLCETQNVKGYPTLLLFRNGQLVSEYQGPRELEELFDFVHKNIIHDEL